MLRRVAFLNNRGFFQKKENFTREILLSPLLLINKPEIITKNRGFISSGENKKPLLKLSFFCKNPLLFNKEILLNIN